MVDLLRPAGRSDVFRLCGHADVNGDLEVVLLLANEGLVQCGVVEAFIGVDVVGGRRPGNSRRRWNGSFVQGVKLKLVLRSHRLVAAIV